MASTVADLFIKLGLVSADFSAGLAKAGAEAEGFSKKTKSLTDGVKLAGEVAAAAGVGIALASVKMASSFQAQMAMLTTQAGVSKNQMGELSAGVLKLAGQVGYDPTSLATALFHVESSFASVGITGPKALDLLKVAAQGAQVGHADLVDVTNALDSAVVSGIPGVQNYQKAMGVLNATVGAGDMTMQDLADAFSTGLLATVKGFGLSITDVGAALATFGDNNIRGAVAATDLRMAVEAMAKPAKAGEETLKGLGMTTTQMAEDMQHGGLLKALEDLKEHMQANGVTAVQQGQILTDIFGKKAGVGVNVLYDQLDRLKSKYPDLTAAANNFGQSWSDTQATFQFKIKQIATSLDALGVKFGLWLIPKVEEFMKFVQDKVAPAVEDFAKRVTPIVENFARQVMSIVERFAENVKTALDSPAVHQAADVLMNVWRNLVSFVGNAITAINNFRVALQPTAALLATIFLGALQAVGRILANNVGPAIVAVSGFFRAHGVIVKDLAEVALAALIAKLLYTKTLLAFDMFTSFVTGIGNAITGIASFGKAVASGQIFDTIRLKAMYAGDAVRGLGAAETAAGEEAATASGAAGIGGMVGNLGMLVGGGALVAGAVIGLSTLGNWVDSLGRKSGDTAAAVNKMTSEMLNIASSGNAANTQMAQLAVAATKVSGLSMAFKPIDDTLAQMVKSGNLKQAQAAIAAIDEQLKAAGLSTDKFHNALSGFTDAAGAYVNQQRETATATQDSTVTTTDATTAMTGLTQSIADATTQQQDMSAGLNADRSMDNFRKSIQDVSKALQDNGNAITGNSDAAMANRDAIRNAVQAMIDNYNANIQNNMTTDQATQKLKEQITQFENQATNSDKTRAAIKAYVDQLDLIPPTKTTVVTADTSKAIANVNALQEQMRQLNNLPTTGPGSTPGGGGGGGHIKAYALGGFVDGPVGAPQLALVHGGEYVVSVDEQRGYGTSPGGSGTLRMGGGPTIIVNVQGSLVAERNIRDLVQTLMLQLGARFSTSYTPYKR